AIDSCGVVFALPRTMFDRRTTLGTSIENTVDTGGPPASASPAGGPGAPLSPVTTSPVVPASVSVPPPSAFAAGVPLCPAEFPQPAPIENAAPKASAAAKKKPRFVRIFSPAIADDVSGEHRRPRRGRVERRRDHDPVEP